MAADVLRAIDGLICESEEQSLTVVQRHVEELIDWNHRQLIQGVKDQLYSDAAHLLHPDDLVFLTRNGREMEDRIESVILPSLDRLLDKVHIHAAEVALKQEKQAQREEEQEEEGTAASDLYDRMVSGGGGRFHKQHDDLEEPEEENEGGGMRCPAVVAVASILARTEAASALLMLREQELSELRVALSESRSLDAELDVARRSTRRQLHHRLSLAAAEQEELRDEMKEELQRRKEENETINHRVKEAKQRNEKVQTGRRLFESMRMELESVTKRLEEIDKRSSQTTNKIAQQECVGEMREMIRRLKAVGYHTPTDVVGSSSSPFQNDDKDDKEEGLNLSPRSSFMNQSTTSEKKKMRNHHHHHHTRMSCYVDPAIALMDSNFLESNMAIEDVADEFFAPLYLETHSRRVERAKKVVSGKEAPHGLMTPSVPAVLKEMTHPTLEEELALEKREIQRQQMKYQSSLNPLQSVEYEGRGAKDMARNSPVRQARVQQIAAASRPSNNRDASGSQHHNLQNSRSAVLELLTPGRSQSNPEVQQQHQQQSKQQQQHLLKEEYPHQPAPSRRSFLQGEGSPPSRPTRRNGPQDRPRPNLDIFRRLDETETEKEEMGNAKKPTNTTAQGAVGVRPPSPSTSPMRRRASDAARNGKPTNKSSSTPTTTLTPAQRRQRAKTMSANSSLARPAASVSVESSQGGHRSPPPRQPVPVVSLSLASEADSTPPPSYSPEATTINTNPSPDAARAIRDAMMMAERPSVVPTSSGDGGPGSAGASRASTPHHHHHPSDHNSSAASVQQRDDPFSTATPSTARRIPTWIELMEQKESVHQQYADELNMVRPFVEKRQLKREERDATEVALRNSEDLQKRMGALRFETAEAIAQMKEIHERGMQ